MIPVLLYHQISTVPEDIDPLGLSIPSKVFREHMSYLKEENYTCMSALDAVKYWQNELKFPEKSFVLTFDDGYKDFYTNAFPILQEFGFTATVFLVANRIDNKSNWTGQGGPAAAKLLSWSQIKELHDAGITFGNHTLSHPRLTQICLTEAKREIIESKSILEENLGSEVTLFSYPYTANNCKLHDIVQESGHVAAFGGDHGDWKLYNIWRSECRNEDSMNTFLWKLSTWYQLGISLREKSKLGKIVAPSLKYVQRALHGLSFKSDYAKKSNRKNVSFQTVKKL